MRERRGNRAIRGHPSSSTSLSFQDRSRTPRPVLRASFLPARDIYRGAYAKRERGKGQTVGGLIVCFYHPSVFADERVSRAILRPERHIPGSFHYASLYLVKSLTIFSCSPVVESSPSAEEGGKWAPACLDGGDRRSRSK